MSAPGYLLFVVLFCVDVSDTETQFPTIETPFTPLYDTPIRLLDGGHRCSGRVELYEAGKWLSLCQEFWNEVWGDVLCRQLGCGERENGTGGEQSAEIQGPGPYWVGLLNCSGTERDWRSCPFTRLPRNAACDRDMAVNIHCTVGPRSLRLSGGTDKCAGTVDVHVDGRWGLLCDDPWDLSLAESVCQFLGCGNVSSLLPGQEGRAEFQSDDCSGNRSSIPDCIQRLNDRQCLKLAGVLCTESLQSKDDPTNVTSVPLTTVVKREDRRHRGSNRELILFLIIAGLSFLLVLESVLFLVFYFRTKRRRVMLLAQPSQRESRRSTNEYRDVSVNANLTSYPLPVKNESTGEHFGNVGMIGISQDQNMDIVRPLGVKVRGAIKRRERMEQDFSSSDEEIQVTRKQSSKRTRRNLGSQIPEDSSSTSSCDWYENVNVKRNTEEGVTKDGDKDIHHLDIPAVNSLQNSNTTLSLAEYENYSDHCLDLTQKDDLAAVAIIEPVAATDNSSGSDYDDVAAYGMS